MLIRALEEEPSLIVPGGEGHCVPRKVLIHTKSSLMLGVLLCSFYNHFSFKEGFRFTLGLGWVGTNTNGSVKTCPQEGRAAFAASRTSGY